MSVVFDVFKGWSISHCHSATIGGAYQCPGGGGGGVVVGVVVGGGDVVGVVVGGGGVVVGVVPVQLTVSEVLCCELIDNLFPEHVTVAVSPTPRVSDLVAAAATP